MNFHVGQKVVCIDDSGLLPDEVRRGEVRTVKGFPYDGFVAVDGDSRSGHYFIWRFRPVKTTSIEVFQKMLAQEPNKPARVKEKANV